MFPIPYILAPARPYTGLGRRRPTLEAIVPGTALVQSGSNISASSASLVITPGGTFVVGNTIIVYAGAGNGISISGGGVSAWSLDITSGAHIPTAIWSGKVTSAAATTVTITQTAAGIAARLQEWAGLLTKDQSTTNSGTTSPITSGSITPGRASELLCAAASSGTAITGGISGGFTDLGIQAPGGGIAGFDAGYLLQGAAAAANPSWTTTTAGWDAGIVSYILAPVPQVDAFLSLLAQ